MRKKDEMSFSSVLFLKSNFRDGEKYLFNLKTF